jgi:hypothetical protein
MSAVADEHVMFQRFFYIFPAMGIKDLKVCVAEFGSGNCMVNFMQENSSLQHPRNAFYCIDKDVSRYKESMEIHNRFISQQRAAGKIEGPVPVEVVEAFLSLGNCNRAILELNGGTPAEFERVVHLYSNAILLSRDESAINMLHLIGSRDSCMTFCSTDDETAKLVPEPILRAVAEAFAGLAMVAVHQKRCFHAIGFANASLWKHPSALAFVNCARMVSCARNDVQTVMYLTEMVILPFFYRSSDTCFRSLYDKELGLWDPEIKAKLSQLPPRLVSTAMNMAKHSTGERRVMKARFCDGCFVERVCRVCNLGIHGEKLFLCSVCRKVYYCSKECQLLDWKEHKALGCKSRVIV